MFAEKKIIKTQKGDFTLFKDFTKLTCKTHPLFEWWSHIGMPSLNLRKYTFFPSLKKMHCVPVFKIIARFVDYKCVLE